MRAFSLVELSIVLVILGLLTGGILSGQSLIRAAELRAVVTEFQTYQTAVQTFRDRYMALPGDMRTATRFWGHNGTACGSHDGNNAGVNGTCNGDGDGIIIETGSAGGTSESFQFWKQLALSGLIEGNYTGLAGSVRADDHDRGINCPASKLSNAIWGSTYFSNSSGSNVGRFAYDYRSSLVFGMDDDNARADGRILTPQEAWNIDNKIDDGKPGTGKMHEIYVLLGCTTATANTELNADYNVSNTAVTCSPVFYQPY